MARVEIRPFLMPDAAGGHRFCLLQVPTGQTPTALVLHAQALGGEMNLARRQVSLTARAWAEAGAAVLIVDPAGCGDSTGDEHDDPWSAWADDLRRAAAWLRSAWPGRPLWGWALRGGSLAMTGAWGPAGGEIAAHPGSRDRADTDGAGPDHWLMWQAMIDGDDLHRHWQRQALAAALSEGREGAAATAAMRDAWVRGETVDVAGSPVSAALAQVDRDRSLVRPGRCVRPGHGRLVWIDVNPQARDTPPPRTAACLSAWRSAGWLTEWHSVPGPSFWLGPEVSTLPALTAATLQAIALPDWSGRDPGPAGGGAG